MNRPSSLLLHLGAISFAWLAAACPVLADDFDNLGTAAVVVRPVSTPDTPPGEASTSVVVRVVALRSVALADTLVCSNGSTVARGSLVSATALLVDGGRLAIVPLDLAANAAAFAIQRESATDLHAAELLHTDVARGVAVLRLLTPIAIQPAAAAGPPPAAGDALTAVSRLAAGELALEPARIEEASSPESRAISVDRTRIEPGRVLFRAGQLAGYMPSLAPDAGRGTRSALIPSAIESVVTAAHGRGALALPDAVSALVARGSVAMLGAETPVPSDRACESLAPIASFTADDVAALKGLTIALPTTRALIATILWNRLALTTGIALSGDVEQDPFLIVEAAFTADNTLGERLPFVQALHRRTVAQHAADETARLARERSEAEAAAAAEARARASAQAEARHVARLNRPITYHVGAGLAFARDGGPGLGGALVTGGFFASVPRLSSSGSIRTSLALGASVGFGGNSGFLGLLSFDLGASLRFGGNTGGFVLLAYAPGVLSGALKDGPTFVPSAYRAAVGIALARRVVTLGYRVMAPAGEYPLHLLELGVAFRHGPAPARRGTPESVASR